MSSDQVRVRFAPSPTGYLHVGGARTALYNYLYAKKTNGKFILRIEDTDEERSTEQSMKMQIGDLQWLGLKWDEGVDPVTLKDIGPYGPYRQSQRQAIYKKYADQLIDEGKAYYCFLTDEEIEEQRQAATKAGRPPQVNSPYRNKSKKEALAWLSEGKAGVVRFKTPDVKRDYVLKDLIRGDVTFPSDMVGDFVLIRSSGMPVYNFCCVIDDALMKITHVLRAEEHLSNTVRQMMIYEALNFQLPQFGHLSIILGEDRQKLSKRHGATSVYEYTQNGYLAMALNNFISLLGWSSPQGQEVFLNIEELYDQFDLTRFNSAPAVFDEKKLKWMNATHLRALPSQVLWSQLQPLFDQAGLKLPTDKEWQANAMELFKTSMETLVDAVPLFKPVSDTPLVLNAEAQEVLSWESTKIVVSKWKELVSNHSSNYLTEQQFLEIQETIKTSCNVKGKFLFMPIRVAIIGQPHGAELKILVPLIDKSILIKRADQILSL